VSSRGQTAVRKLDDGEDWIELELDSSD